MCTLMRIHTCMFSHTCTNKQSHTPNSRAQEGSDMVEGIMGRKELPPEARHS